MFAFLSLCTKWRDYWAFLVRAVVLMDQFRSSTIYTPRNLVLLTGSERKSRIQWQRGVLKPNVLSFLYQLLMVLV